MAIQIGAKPDSGFDDPIGMLKDCHRRIERFHDILCKVVKQARGRELDTEERRAVEAALAYFRESGPRHNLDEEESLFPRLLCRQVPAVSDDVHRLEAEHRETKALHEEADRLYSKWVAERGLATDDESQLLSITEQLQGIYGGHIHLEEDVIFPCAAHALGQSDLTAIGAEFKTRRGL